MNKQWYMAWQKRLTASKFQLETWRFFGITIVYSYVAAGVVLFTLPQTRPLAWQGLWALGLGWGVFVKLVRFLAPTKRPYQAYQLHALTGGLFSRIHQSPNSFPSGHAAGIGALSTVFAFAYPAVGIVSFTILVANGFARIVLGYHYALDIVVGALLGIIAGIIVIFAV